MTTFTPIVLPPPANSAWERAREIVVALRARGKANAFIVGALANGFAESWWMPLARGDNDQSFGPWQMKWVFYGQPILDMLHIDIRTETSLARHVDAVLFALALPANEKTLAALAAAATGEAATRAWAAGFERASAGGSVDRRAAIAAPLEVWLAEVK